MDTDKDTEKEIPFIAYTDVLSVRPEESIGFKVSGPEQQRCQASLHRSISADPNPNGAGIVEEDYTTSFLPDKQPIEFVCKRQNWKIGSSAESSIPVETTPWLHDLLFSVIIFPTALSSRKGHEQVIMKCGQYAIVLRVDGILSFRFHDQEVAACNKAICLQEWYEVGARVYCESEQAHFSLYTHRMDITRQEKIDQSTIPGIYRPLNNTQLGGALKLAIPFNGKIEKPSIHADGKCIIEYDLHGATNESNYVHAMCSETVPSSSSSLRSSNHLILHNEPTRAVTSSRWDGSEMCFKSCPSHYAAIYFHDDDCSDFKWETTFSFQVPETLPSGVYVMRLKCCSTEGYTDAVPFFVLPPTPEKRRQSRPKLCVLISTFTYVIYGNNARIDYTDNWDKRTKEWNGFPYNPANYPNYGLSTYNLHTDGSGICHASHNRPLLNMRPGYLTFGSTSGICSGLRHFPADSHLIAWLHHQGVDYDIITDHEMHSFPCNKDSKSSLYGYECLMTGTHPEYHTLNTLDHLTDFRDKCGGNIIYTGGNGFYWKIAVHPYHPSRLEIRRAEDGLRAWASLPGEYYNSYDGSYGGLWRRNGRPPQKLVGIGFAAQGGFIGNPYKRVNFDSKFDWVFKDVENDHCIGAGGYSGNGAAGYELDRVDPLLAGGSISERIVILAQSYGHSFMLIPEEQLTHQTNLQGTDETETKRADIIYFELDNGAKVFSVGSITFCGSLPVNNFENDISKLLHNVLRRFMSLIKEV